MRPPTDRNTVLIIGDSSSADAAFQGGGVDNSFTADQHVADLMRVLAPLGVRSHCAVLDTDSKKTGLQVVFQKEDGARDAVLSLHGQTFFDFTLCVKSAAFSKEELDKEKQEAAEAAKIHPLLPHNHLMPADLQFNLRLLERLEEKKHGGAALEELRTVQKEAAEVKAQIGEKRAVAEEETAQKKAAAEMAKKQAIANVSAESDPLEVVCPTAADAAMKQSVFFDGVPLSADLIASLLTTIVVQFKVAVHRWALAAASPAFKNQQHQMVAVVVQLPTEKTTSTFVATASRGIEVRLPGMSVFKFQPMAAAAAVQRGWISSSVFPLPAHDATALLGSRETDDVVRDLKLSLKF